MVIVVDAVNPILISLGRTLVEATAAHVNRDTAGVDAALERSSKLAGRLMDAVGGCSSMGSRIGEDAINLYSAIESIEVEGEYTIVFDALARAIGLTIIVGRVANGPNPFERVPDADVGDDAILPTVGSRGIARA